MRTAAPTRRRDVPFRLCVTPPGEPTGVRGQEAGGGSSMTPSSVSRVRRRATTSGSSRRRGDGRPTGCRCRRAAPPCCTARAAKSAEVYRAAAVGVEDQPRRRLALHERHAQGVFDQFGAHAAVLARSGIARNSALARAAADPRSLSGSLGRCRAGGGHRGCEASAKSRCSSGHAYCLDRSGGGDLVPGRHIGDGSCDLAGLVV